jgi:hypothetical protein
MALHKLLPNFYHYNVFDLINAEYFQIYPFSSIIN